MTDFATRRADTGLTQLQLAARAGVSPTTLRNIEQGFIPSKSRAAERIEAALTALEKEKA